MNINVFEKEAGKDQSVKGAEKISYAAYSKKDGVIMAIHIL